MCHLAVKMAVPLFYNVSYHQPLFCPLLQKIIIDGIRGGGDSGDAALDDFTFQRGPCRETGTETILISFTLVLNGSLFYV